MLETLEQVRERPPEPPSRLNPRVPRDLETICLKCLEKDPRRRYGSAEALAEDLRRYLAGEPILARPVGAAERGWLWCRRHPAVAGLVSALVLSLMLGSVVSTVMAVRARAEARRADSQAERADQEARQSRAEAVRADRASNEALERRKHADRRLYAAHMNLIQQAWERGDVKRVREFSSATPRARSVPRTRTFAASKWYYFDRLCRSELLSIPGYASAFSPASHRIAIQTDNFRSFSVWDLKERKLVRRFTPPDVDHRLIPWTTTFCSDGRFVAAASMKRGSGEVGDSKVYIWDVSLGQVRRCFSMSGQDINAIAFSPDDRLLAVSGASVAAWVWDISRDEKSSRSSDHVTKVATIFR